MRQISVKAARVASGMSQAELADKMGVSRNTICFWENNKRGMTKSHLIAFCTLTGFDEDEIFLPKESA